MQRYRFQCVILNLSLPCVLWNMVPQLLGVISANPLDASTFRIQHVESTDNCQDHTMHSRSTFALEGEPLVLKCPFFKHQFMDTSELALNLTWHKNTLATVIPAGYKDTRIIPQGDDLWFVPLSLEDSGQYICVQRNSSYCAAVSVHLTVIEKSAARDICYPQKAFISGPGKLVCPNLEDFVQKNTDYGLKWFKDSTPLAIDNEKFSAWRGTNFLTIHSVSSNDSGFYACQMSFEHEATEYNVTRIIQLQILGRKKKSSPVIVYPSEKVTLAAAGSQLIIPCRVFVGASNPFYTHVWWQANNTIIGGTSLMDRVKEGTRQELGENEDNYIEVPLIFEHVEEADFNTDFICVARNSRGHQAHALQVKQEEPDLSWQLATIPVALAALIVGGVCMHKCWSRRSARGYIVTKS